MSATSNTPAAASETGTPKRKRASRKGQPRRFECLHDDCDKRYSRAEHLARHELNHSPKEVYRCDEVGCDNTFVRHDLYKRHKKKHEEATSPNRDVDVFPTGSGPLQTHADHHNHGSAAQPAPSPPTTCFNTVQTSYMRTAAEPYAHSTNHGFRDEASLISQPGQTATNGNVTTSQHPHHAAADSMGRLETAYGANSTWLPDQMTAGSGGDTYMGAIGDLQASDNFASWLFDSPGSQQQEFNLTNLPFLDFGLDYSPTFKLLLTRRRTSWLTPGVHSVLFACLSRVESTSHRSSLGFYESGVHPQYTSELQQRVCFS
ncbi:hypothetical protein KC354_g7342 [Hortaea werneckii]|nr:hypothetical protein KC354_g7342 [Hortaea werneckii]